MLLAIQHQSSTNTTPQHSFRFILLSVYSLKMRTTTAILFGFAGLCNIALAQNAACTSDAQAAYIPLVGNEDAAEYCFDKVHDRSDDNASESSITTATTTADSLRFRRRTTGRGKKEDNSGHRSGDDEEKQAKRYIPSYCQRHACTPLYLF